MTPDAGLVRRQRVQQDETQLLWLCLVTKADNHPGAASAFALGLSGDAFHSDTPELTEGKPTVRKNQITIPAEGLREAGITPRDKLHIRVKGPDRLEAEHDNHPGATRLRLDLQARPNGT